MSANNPFTFGTMITNPERFIGRRHELEIITGRLNGAQPEGCSVVGPRRIGKSSLLQYLQHSRASESLRPAADQHIVYLSATDSRCAAMDGFRAALTDALLQNIRIDMRTVEGRRLTEVRTKLTDGQPCSWNMAETVLKSLRSLEHHPVVCLDEFEALLTQDFDSRFFDGLRNWANEGLLTWITASTQPLLALSKLAGHSSPFFNILATVRLGDLMSEEVDQLLAMADQTPYGFTEHERRMMRRLAGTNPYHLQIVAWRLWEDKAAGRPVREFSLRQFLRDQPNPPQILSNHQFGRPAWAIVIALLVLISVLVARLARYESSLLERGADYARGALALACSALTGVGNLGQIIGGLFLVLVIVAIALRGIKRRQRTRDILRSLWRHLTGGD